MMWVMRKHQDAVRALVDEYGPDAELTATVVLPGAAEVAVNGQALDGWTGSMVAVFDANTLMPVAGSVLVEAPNGAKFAIGEMLKPRDGDQVFGTVADLVAHPAPTRLQG